MSHRRECTFGSRMLMLTPGKWRDLFILRTLESGEAIDLRES